MEEDEINPFCMDSDEPLKINVQVISEGERMAQAIFDELLEKMFPNTVTEPQKVSSIAAEPESGTILKSVI